jgi:hypothetical protein
MPASAFRCQSSMTVSSTTASDRSSRRGSSAFRGKNGLVDDGKVAYLTFKALVKHVDAFGSKLLRDFANAQVGELGAHRSTIGL